jgi:hypothetical protein
VSGPFERLDIDGLDDSLACVDGVCAVPPGRSAGGSAEGFVQQGAGAGLERDAGDEDERVG